MNTSSFWNKEFKFSSPTPKALPKNVKEAIREYAEARDDWHGKDKAGVPFLKVLWAEWKMVRAREKLIDIVACNPVLMKVVFLGRFSRGDFDVPSRVKFANDVVEELSK